MLSILDKLRRDISPRIDKATRSEFGQYLTPSSVAGFMASLFTFENCEKIKLLDPGAGIGTLSIAFYKRIKQQPLDLTSKLEVIAYEVDSQMADKLREVFTCHFEFVGVRSEVRSLDFIDDAVSSIRFRHAKRFTHAILNPPYKKISSQSAHRRWLRTAGIETVNLYSAFVALAILLLENHGQLVAIIPRSFCNGPYYRPFRNLILRETAIRSIHLFHTRDKAFRDDSVLQENVIVQLERGAVQKNVVVSTSSDDSFSDLERRTFPFEAIVCPGDDGAFFHIPTTSEPHIFELNQDIGHSLPSLDIEVSTGPVVDFRLRRHLSKSPGEGMAPLLYPGHFVDDSIDWPKANWKKANAIEVNRETLKWLLPKGNYTIVRRFSSKEEKRRINASVVNAESFSDFDFIGFENKLNVFHFRRHGLDEAIAYGLAIYLNSSGIDEYFRRFNGHTQVNATDLRALKYPSLERLRQLGELAKLRGHTDQNTADEILNSVK